MSGGVTLQLKSEYDSKGSDQAVQAIDKVEKTAQKSESTFSQMKGVVTDVWSAFSMAGTAIDYLQGVADAGAKLENAMINLKDVSGLSSDAVSQLTDEFMKLSPGLSMTADEMLNVAASASSIGVANKDIEAFTDVIGKVTIGLGDYTGGAEGVTAATSRLMQAYKLTVPEVEKLWSAIGVLGDKTRGGEEAIAGFMEKFAPVASQFGIGADQAAGMGQAFLNMGLDGERAAQTIQMSLIAMQDKLDKSAMAAGMLPGEFKKLADTDTLAAFQAVLSGLSGIQSDTERTSAITDIFGNRAVGALSGIVSRGIQPLTDALKTSEQAWKDNTAVTENYELRADSLTNKMKELNAEWTNAKSKLAVDLAPAIGLVIEAMGALGTVVSGVADGWGYMFDAAKLGIDYMASAVPGLSDIMRRFDEAEKTHFETLNEWFSSRKKYWDEVNAKAQKAADDFNANLDKMNGVITDMDTLTIALAERFGITTDATALWGTELQSLFKSIGSGVPTMEDFYAAITTWGERLNMSFGETIEWLSKIPTQAKESSMGIAEYMQFLEDSWKNGWRGMTETTDTELTLMNEIVNDKLGIQESDFDNYWSYLLALVKGGYMSMRDASIEYANWQNGFWEESYDEFADTVQTGIDDAFDDSYFEETGRDNASAYWDSFEQEYQSRNQQYSQQFDQGSQFGWSGGYNERRDENGNWEREYFSAPSSRPGRNNIQMQRDLVNTVNLRVDGRVLASAMQRVAIGGRLS